MFNLRRIRHGRGCEVSVSTVEGSRVNSRRPSRQRRETRSSWCPSVRLPSLRCPEQKQELDPLHSSTERVGSLLSSPGATKGPCCWFSRSCLSTTPKKAAPELLLISEFQNPL